jgi:GNAT superfamily N-acetyltransferase
VSLTLVDLEPGDPRLERDVLPVLAELRTELTPASFASIYAEGHPQGLRFTAAFDDQNRCVGVAGWRVIATTVAVRKLYVDDLVTTAAARGLGVGAALIAELTERARQAGCSAIDLDSAVHRADAHRFYMRERMAITAFHFGRPLR